MMAQGKTEFRKARDKKKPEIEGFKTWKEFRPDDFKNVFNQKEVRKGEVPSANCHGTARGMAELASIMANKGQSHSTGADGHSTPLVLMSQVTWNKMHDGEKLAVDAVLPDGRYNVVYLRVLIE